MIQIKLKRVYEELSEVDGYRVLVDRLWPRGMKKEHLKMDEWAKGLTPSTDLRKWFHVDMAGRWKAFEAIYRKELEASDVAKEFIGRIKTYQVVTLLYASKDPVHNHARILKTFLDEELANVK